MFSVRSFFISLITWKCSFLLNCSTAVIADVLQQTVFFRKNILKVILVKRYCRHRELLGDIEVFWILYLKYKKQKTLCLRLKDWNIFLCQTSQKIGVITKLCKVALATFLLFFGRFSSPVCAFVLAVIIIFNTPRQRRKKRKVFLYSNIKLKVPTQGVVKHLFIQFRPRRLRQTQNWQKLYE